jgi:hypothetical protein
MSVLSVINQLNLENPKKCFILPIIIFGLLYVKSVCTEEIGQSSLQYSSDENEGTVEGLLYCDENLIKNRESSKRCVKVN